MSHVATDEQVSILFSSFLLYSTTLFPFTNSPDTVPGTYSSVIPAQQHHLTNGCILINVFTKSAIIVLANFVPIAPRKLVSPSQCNNGVNYIINDIARQQVETKKFSFLSWQIINRSCRLLMLELIPLPGIAELTTIYQTCRYNAPFYT